MNTPMSPKIEKYDFSATEHFIRHEIPIDDLKREVMESALGLSHIGGDNDPITREKAIREAQLTALTVLDFLKTIQKL